MKIVRAIQQAGSIASNPNDRIGYGIPDMKKAFTSLLIDFASLSATGNDCEVTLNWTSKDVAAMKYEIERKTPGNVNYIKIAEVNPQAGKGLTTLILLLPMYHAPEAEPGTVHRNNCIFLKKKK